MKRFKMRRPFGWLVFFAFMIPAVLGSPNQFRGLPISTLTPQQQINLEAGFAALEQNKYMSANRLFIQIVQQQPENPIGWLALSWAPTSAEQFDKAADKAQKLKPKGTQAEQILSEIQSSYVQGNFEQRVAWSEKLVKAYPDSSLAWWIKGNVHSEVKQNEEARLAYEKATKIAPTEVMPYIAMGNNYLFGEPKDFVKAESMFLKATYLEPANTNAHIGLGDARRAQNKLELALEDYTRASLLEPDSGSAFSKKGHANTFLGKYSDAQKDYQTAINVGEPQNTIFLGNYKAFTHIYQNKPEKSVQELQQWLTYIDSLPIEEHQKVQGKIFTTTNLAMIQLHTGMLDQVAGTLKQREALIEHQIEKVDDKMFNRIQRANIHFYRGYLQARQGNLTVAADTADKMQQLLTPVKDPQKLEDYHELMGFISLKSENWDNAVAHYDKANDKKVYVKYHKALALEQKGEKKAAHNLYVEVKNYNFNSVDYALVRGDAVQKSRFVTAMVFNQK